MAAVGAGGDVEGCDEVALADVLGHAEWGREGAVGGFGDVLRDAPQGRAVDVGAGSRGEEGGGEGWGGEEEGGEELVELHGGVGGE